MFHIKDFDVRTVKRFDKRVHTLGINRGRNAAQNNNLAFVIEAFTDVLARNTAKFRVVARNINVFDARKRKTTVNHGDKLARLFDLLDRNGQRIRFKRQDDQRVDILNRHQIFKIVCLFGCTIRADHNDIDIGIGCLNTLFSLFGMPVQATCPTMGRCRDRNPDLDLFLCDCTG